MLTDFPRIQPVSISSSIHGIIGPISPRKVLLYILHSAIYCCIHVWLGPNGIPLSANLHML